MLSKLCQKLDGCDLVAALEIATHHGDILTETHYGIIIFHSRITLPPRLSR